MNLWDLHVLNLMYKANSGRVTKESAMLLSVVVEGSQVKRNGNGLPLSMSRMSLMTPAI